VILPSSLVRPTKLLADTADCAESRVIDGPHRHDASGNRAAQPVNEPWSDKGLGAPYAVTSAAFPSRSPNGSVGRLPVPEDTTWAPAREKVRRILARAAAARAVTSRDRQDLRGWHYILTGGVLATLSPYGFAGMTGRWAYLSDSAGGCAAALARLRLILGAADTAPEAVALLPDRSSRILGAAAAVVHASTSEVAQCLP
jgi:hypothetical protein